MTSVAAEQFHREHEPGYYERKCRYCREAESRCECDMDVLADQARDDRLTESER